MEKDCQEALARKDQLGGKFPSGTLYARHPTGPLSSAFLMPGRLVRIVLFPANLLPFRVGIRDCDPGTNLAYYFWMSILKRKKK
jgi:hypothetical protein